MNVVFALQAKVVPGTLKRGKAAKQALEYALKSTALTVREREVAGQIKDNHLTMAMVGECKVMPSGSVAASTKKGKK